MKDAAYCWMSSISMFICKYASKFKYLCRDFSSWSLSVPIIGIFCHISKRKNFATIVTASAFPILVRLVRVWYMHKPCCNLRDRVQASNPLVFVFVVMLGWFCVEWSSRTFGVVIPRVSKQREDYIYNTWNISPLDQKNAVPSRRRVPEFTLWIH